MVERCVSKSACGRLRQAVNCRQSLAQGSGFLPVGYGFVPFSAAVPYPPTARRTPGYREMPYPPSPSDLPCQIGVLEDIDERETTRIKLGCETSAVRVARRRRTDMVMQASMWVLGVAAVERRSVVGMRGTETAVGAREPARRPTHTLPPRKHSPSLAARQAPPIPSHVF